MIRPELEKLGVGTTQEFTGKYKKHGKNYRLNGITYTDVCIEDLTHNEKYITDHVWIDRIPLFVVREMKKGDKVSVHSTIKSYGENGVETSLHGGSIKKL